MCQDASPRLLSVVIDKTVAQEWPRIVDQWAAQGWRLVTVDRSVAFFERPVPEQVSPS
jgi:hypothetical protein